MNQQREGYERQLYEQAQMLQTMVNEKESLRSKMEKVYERTSARMTDDESKHRYEELVT